MRRLINPVVAFTIASSLFGLGMGGLDIYRIHQYETHQIGGHR